MKVNQEHVAFACTLTTMGNFALIAKFEDLIRQGMGPSHWKMDQLRKEMERRMWEVRVIVRGPSPIECTVQALRDKIRDGEADDG